MDIQVWIFDLYLRTKCLLIRGKRSFSHSQLRLEPGRSYRLLLIEASRQLDQIGDGENMTAEIAILNKAAVALAADSAVTIGRGGNAKIYNTVSKIFELSDKCPVGIMIFNRLDYMNIPLEVLIKEYRKLRRNFSFKTIDEWKKDFIKFLSAEVKYTKDDEFENMQMIIFDALDILKNKFDISLNRHISQTNKLLRSKFNAFLENEATSLSKDLAQTSYAPGFTSRKMPIEIEEEIERMARQHFELVNISQKALGRIKDYVGQYLSRQKLSSFRTGIVITGFGDEEIFPTLVHFEIDGIVLGKLKIDDRNRVDIDRRGTAAEILGFAQDDMVQSFVNGADPLYRSYVKSLVESAIKQSANDVLSVILTDKSQIDKVMKSLDDTFVRISNDYSMKSDKFINSKFTQEVKTMVRSMPKQELATLAESLIEITSLKRKVTRERETVGGEVDVAVISKSEGLVWVRRKHYFPPELNARFLARHFRREELGDGKNAR